MGVIVHAAALVAIGWLGDRVSPRVMIVAGVASLALLAFPFYGALASHTIAPVWALALGGVCASLVNGTFAVLLADLFPTRVRFSGVALGFNVAFTVFSGTAPLVATSLIRETGMNTAPAFVMVWLCADHPGISQWCSRDGEGMSLRLTFTPFPFSAFRS